MVYTISGIRFPAIPSAHGLSSRSSFNGDRRSPGLSLLLKKNSVSRNPSFSIFLPVFLPFFAVIFLCYIGRKIFAKNSDKVLVPGGKSDASAPVTVSEDPQVLDVEDLIMEDVKAVEDTVIPPSQVADLNDNDLLEETSGPLEVVTGTTTVETTEIKRTIPPPGTGQRIYEIDPALNVHQQHLDYR
ncbi:hypothetical protein TIFTF001_050416 [Ficus carica]|uniref:Uncharacterized protein n=1 Tax=Ficus carica TaxID=3494 RepID=A0AA88CR85_FICCA|nr:hypothetical protein TIFTF001_050416 [Ficus carica]